VTSSPASSAACAFASGGGGRFEGGRISGEFLHALADRAKSAVRLRARRALWLTGAFGQVHSDALGPNDADSRRSAQRVQKFAIFSPAFESTARAAARQKRKPRRSERRARHARGTISCGRATPPRSGRSTKHERMSRSTIASRECYTKYAKLVSSRRGGVDSVPGQALPAGSIFRKATRRRIPRL